MRYQWPELAKRGWIGARILAVGAALVLFAFGHRFEAQAQTASVGEACFTYGYCAVVGYAPYYGVYSGYCSSARPCWCYGTDYQGQKLAKRDTVDCSNVG